MSVSNGPTPSSLGIYPLFVSVSQVCVLSQELQHCQGSDGEPFSNKHSLYVVLDSVDEN